MSRARRAIPLTTALLLFVSTATGLAAVELGPTRLGLPGLGETVVAPEDRTAPLRLGVFWETATVDNGFGFASPSFKPSVGTQSFRLQAGLRMSPGLWAAASLPYRSYDVERGPSESGLGDLQLGLSARFFRLHRLRVGGWGILRLPTGDENKGLSTNKTEGEFGLHTTLPMFHDSPLPEARWHTNIGLRINQNDSDGYGVLDDAVARPDTTGVFPPLYPAVGPTESSRSNDMILLRTAIEFRRRWAHLFLEASVDWLYDDDDSSFKESASWITPGVYLGREGGPGLKASWAIALFAEDADTEYSPALPDWVLSLGVNYPIFLGGRDRDADGVPDKRDGCPEEPEDFDGFEDEDGCPDRDNDQDGVPDRYDLAPNLAEDFDGFEDADGRPDLDNDFDGIPDVDDECPNQPEDFDGFQDEDGCPDVILDIDGDGVLDADDVCPETPEDFDGFEDRDGCPEPDNDLDGIPDVDDGCPDEREDYDGVEDEDGCPDEDVAPGSSESR